MRDIATKVTGNNLTADEFNDIPTELENAITSAGITLSGADLTQLSKAIAHYVSNSSFYTDTGAADVYLGTVIGTNQSPPAYVNGMEVEFVVGNTNTGASTLNVNSLGVKNITATASAGTLVAGDFARLRYNTGSGEFDIVSTTTPTAASAISFSNGTTGLAATDVQAALDEGLGTALDRVSAAWTNFDGTGTVAKNDDFNVTSITDNGTGDYTANFTAALADINYAVAIGGSSASGGAATAGANTFEHLTNSTTLSRTTAALRMITFNSADNANDSLSVSLIIFGG